MLTVEKAKIKKKNRYLSSTYLWPASDFNLIIPFHANAKKNKNNHSSCQNGFEVNKIIAASRSSQNNHYYIANEYEAAIWCCS